MSTERFILPYQREIKFLFNLTAMREACSLNDVTKMLNIVAEAKQYTELPGFYKSVVAMYLAGVAPYTVSKKFLAKWTILRLKADLEKNRIKPEVISYKAPNITREIGLKAHPDDTYEYDDHENQPDAVCPSCGRRNVSEYHMANCEAQEREEDF